MNVLFPVIFFSDPSRPMGDDPEKQTVIGFGKTPACISEALISSDQSDILLSVEGLKSIIGEHF